MTDKVFKVDIILRVKKSIKVRARDEDEARREGEALLFGHLKDERPYTIEVKEI